MDRVSTSRYAGNSWSAASGGTHTLKFIFDNVNTRLSIGAGYYPTAGVHVQTTSEQARFAYDANNYMSVGYDSLNVVGGAMVLKTAGTERVRIDTTGAITSSYTTSQGVRMGTGGTGYVLAAGAIHRLDRGVAGAWNLLIYDQTNQRGSSWFIVGHQAPEKVAGHSTHLG
mgnify:CR=1 FL=1